MTPKELLTKLEKEMLKASPDMVVTYSAVYEGAKMMHEAYLNKQRKYYESHREHNREYHREWARKQKEKEVDAGK